MKTLPANCNFVWFPREGYGRSLVPPSPILYDEDYFAEYVRRCDNGISAALNSARIDMVQRRLGAGDVLDFGGCTGYFAVARNERLKCECTYVYDCNPFAVKSAMELGLFAMPHAREFAALTFWDSFEHLETPEIFLPYAKEWVFLSMPIFRGPEHAMASKHFKPGEHVWYFTEPGLIQWFDERGLMVEEVDDKETKLGREDVLNFAFRRTPQ